MSFLTFLVHIHEKGGESMEEAPRYRVVRSDELKPSPRGTIAFEGEPDCSGVSMFLIDYQPGDGPGLHKHPYPETWVVRNGHARFTVGGQTVDAGTGDVVVAAEETRLTSSRMWVPADSTSFVFTPRRYSSKRIWNDDR
jgi:mannose-6-phosphate isomerase-like protein (cupin superfamily)